ncbi:YunG family protein [Bradyrhizobium guangdongense]
MSFDPDEVQSVLRKAWSLSTASQWTADNPAKGQCNVTALLVHELFGGDLLKTPLPAGDHFYNRIEGRRYDFTASQFDRPIAYIDLPTSRAEAERGATSAQRAALRMAFGRCRASSG